MAKYRKERVSELIHSFLAEQIIRFTDPRMRLVTITAVEMSPDLKSAWVYWTKAAFVEGGSETESGTKDQSEPKEPISTEEKRVVTDALNGSAKLLKRRIGEELKLRYTPDLVFRYDDSIATGARIDYLLKKAGF